MNDSLVEKYPGRTVRCEGNQIVVTIPVKFYRRNGRQMIASQSSDDVSCESRSGINTELVTAIAKAYQWQEQLESGRYNTIEELASAKKVDRSYVSRILRLTSLSPQVVMSILNGEGNNNLSLRRLRIGIPDLWTEQKSTVDVSAPQQ